ncbi:MAG: hypothetical protein ACRCVK_05320, partial [Aeromonas veronii]
MQLLTVKVMATTHHSPGRIAAGNDREMTKKSLVKRQLAVARKSRNSSHIRRNHSESGHKSAGCGLQPTLFPPKLGC